jgi:3-phenylpropionate/trans-cinnamate dioxygenase ferredoxin subunit
MMYNYAQLSSDKLEYIEVCPVGELPNGERLFLEIGEYQIVLFNIAGGFFAIADRCSHDDGPLGDGELEHNAPGDQHIICPRHGARFDLRSGAALSLPATEDIPAYPVVVEQGVVKVGIPVDNG